jgi:hypothetical protein
MVMKKLKLGQTRGAAPTEYKNFGLAAGKNKGKLECH